MAYKGQGSFEITAILYTFWAYKTLFGLIKLTKPSVQMAYESQSIFGKPGNGIQLWRVQNIRHPLLHIIVNGKALVIFIYQSSHPTWKTRNFVIFFSRPGKYLEFAQKVIKTRNFNSKPGKKTWNFQILCFKLHFSRCDLLK